METIRTDKELLVLLRDNIHYIENRGMCLATIILADKWIITHKEEQRLDNIILDNKPLETCGTYYFPEGEQQQRVDFLNNLINKL